MQISFPVQSVAPQESVTALSSKTTAVSDSSSSAAAQKEPAPFFNPKITVDAPSGMVLLQFRAQGGELRMQIPSENVVSYYNTYGHFRVEPLGTTPQAGEGAVQINIAQPQASMPTPSAPQPQATPAPATPSGTVDSVA